MHEAPSLSPEALADKLGELFKPRPEPSSRWRRTLAAIHGRCEAQTLEVAGQQIRVVPVASELELRRALPELYEREPLAFVLGYPAIEVPVDLAGRFVRRGRVAHLGRHERLRRLFSGRGPGEGLRGTDSLIQLDAELVDSALARALLRERERVGDLAGGLARVTLDQAYARWLHLSWRTPTQLSLDNLLAYVASSDRHEAFLAATDPARAPELAGLREELLVVLARSVAPEASLVWRTWLAGHGRTLLEFAALFEAYEVQPSAALDDVLLITATQTLAWTEAEYEAARPALAAAAETALELYAERWDASERRKLLARAEGHLRERHQVHLRGSRRLPIAWTLRLDALGEALAQLAAEPKPSEADYQRVSERVRELELHESIRLAEHRALYAQAEMARRLAAFLVVRSDRRWDRRWVRAGDPLAKFEGLALWYAQEGGYLDLARRRARGAGAGEFKRGVAAVVEAVDAIRAGHDRSFAAGLAKWIEQDRPRRRVLPIDELVARLGVDYLKSPAGAKLELLVLVLDGMAWAQAVELLDELGSEAAATRWSPLSFNREAVKLDARANFVPVIAGLPTVTNVSRSALFAGEPTLAGVAPRSEDDERRWAAHPGAASLFAGTRKPALLSAREAFVEDGLSATTRTALRDPDQPIVAILINTIDAALKSDKLDEAPWTVARIRPLRALLDAAHEAGRAVLLCSDHGNVPGQRLRYANVRSGSGSGRWRPWLAGDAIQEFEQAIASPPAWRPPEPAGARGVVLINDEVLAYTGAPHHGEHGGATLAEVIAPAILLATEQPGHSNALGQARAHEFLAAGPPPWWLDEVRQAEGLKAKIDAAADKQLAKQLDKQRAEASAAPEPDPQLSLAVVTPEPAPDPDPAAAAEAQALARAQIEAELAEKAAKSRARGKKWTDLTATTEKLLDKLESNPLFEARADTHAKREEALAALEYLLEHQDRASAEYFAKRMGRSERRVAQVVSTLSTVLNVDGYDVLRYDPKTKQVVLDRELLVQGFGL